MRISILDILFHLKRSTQFESLSIKQFRLILGVQIGQQKLIYFLHLFKTFLNRNYRLWLCVYLIFDLLFSIDKLNAISKFKFTEIQTSSWGSNWSANFLNACKIIDNG